MKVAEKFQKKFDKELKQSGFKAVEGRRYQYYIELPNSGELGLTFRVEPPGKFVRKTYANIFCMFSDPQKAIKAGYNCNQFSGKYNFICLDEIHIIEAVFSNLTREINDAKSNT